MTGMWRFQIELTESQYEALKEVARAWGDDSPEQYLYDAVLQSLQSDIDLMFGNSEAIVQELNRKLELQEAA
jgi:hypothetical protein